MSHITDVHKQDEDFLNTIFLNAYRDTKSVKVVCRYGKIIDYYVLF